ncbi:MAG: YgiT-type zinc finger protein, partial [Selenomonas sp.]|nr:YgiT-type zinc finger protein [Selenomonas sp.]
IIVKGVPSHVCTQCGEVSYDTDVVVRLEKIVDNMKKSSMEIAVSSYEAA